MNSLLQDGNVMIALGKLDHISNPDLPVRAKEDIPTTFYGFMDPQSQQRIFDYGVT